MYVYSTLPWANRCEGLPHNTLMTFIALILKEIPSNMKGHAPVFLEIHIFILGRFTIRPDKWWLGFFIVIGFFGFF